MPDLLREGRKRYPQSNISFLQGDFLANTFEQTPDFAIASGVFTHKLEDVDNYAVIESAMTKAYAVCKDGLHSTLCQIKLITR